MMKERSNSVNPLLLSILCFLQPSALHTENSLVALSVVNQHEHQCANSGSHTVSAEPQQHHCHVWQMWWWLWVKDCLSFLHSFDRGGFKLILRTAGSFRFIYFEVSPSKVVMVINFVLIADEATCLPTSWREILTCSMVPEGFFSFTRLVLLSVLGKTIFNYNYWVVLYLPGHWTHKFGALFVRRPVSFKQLTQ